VAEKELHGATIVALVMDLMFASRVRGVAPDADIARGPEALLEAVGPGTRLVLVDLQARGALEALQGLNERDLGETRVVAWGPHVMEDALAAARGTGAEVMARGAFVKALSGLVAEAAQT
jgi:hypothetical protein